MKLIPRDAAEARGVCRKVNRRKASVVTPGRWSVISHFEWANANVAVIEGRNALLQDVSKLVQTFVFGFERLGIWLLKKD